MRYSVTSTSVLKTRNRNVVVIALGKAGWKALLADPRLGQKVKSRYQFMGSPDDFASEIVPEGTNHRWVYVIRAKDRLDKEGAWSLGKKIARSLPDGLKRVDMGVVGTEWPILIDVLEGMELSGYDPANLGYKKDSKPSRSKDFVLHLDTRKLSARREAEYALHRLSRRMDAVTEARRLVDTPPNDLSPEELAAKAMDLVSGGHVDVEIHDDQWLIQQGFGLHLAVGQGSVRPPRLLHMKWGNGPRSIAVVGKGITFDSGGLSIKHPNKYMEDMKMDMAGGAAVIGLFRYLRDEEPSSEVTVHGLVPMADNMPDGASVKPGDVIRGYGGKTVEILNTDAEGRLVLADSISYSVKDLAAKEVVTIATLTGACMVALGPYTAGWFSTNERLARRIEKAIEESGESYWRLPLLDNLRSSLKSTIADIKNVGGSYGGAITAGLFLSSFAEKTPFAHMDIAGPAFLSSSHGPYRAGATGFGVMTLISYAVSFKKDQ